MSESKAQITETSSVLNVCAPATITFTAPAGASSILWTFGPYPSSTSSTGGFAVINAGTFSATFSGVVGGNPVTFTVAVTVNPKPVANFSIQQPPNDCAVKSITLVNTSTGAAPIVGWTWVYGDGGISNFTVGTPHSYGYGIAGTYSVTLQITDANGCDDQKTVGTVSVINSPTAVISSNPAFLVGCQATFSAAFSASNSIGNNLSYNWNFGNGQSSTQVTSNLITYTSQTAQYLVTLTVTSQGCKNIAQQYVTVSPATLAVAVSPTVCLNAPFVATVTSNQPYSIWNFGSSSLFYYTPPPNSPTVFVQAYTTPGTKTITVNAGNLPCVANPVTFTVFVDQVTANFSGSNPTVSCASPFAVSYTSTSSSNATTFTWSVLNTNSVVNTYTGNTATHVFSGGSPNAYAVFVRAYTPTVTLFAQSAAGCLASITKTVHSIERPAAWFNVSKSEGCVPLVVSLFDSSIVYPSCPIISYTWNSGAAPPTIITGTLAIPQTPNTRIPTPTFTYTSPGTYSPYLIIETASNYTNISATCTDPSYTAVITAVNPPTVSFNVPPGPFCPDQFVQITNTSQNISTVQHWHVASDNGYFSGCINDPNPAWKFTNVGTFNFTLTGYQNSCSSSAVSGPITVKGPICKARYETNCAVNRAAVEFSVELQEVATATLFFGDGNNTTFTGNIAPASVVNASASHTYNASGDYTASLVSANPGTGCSNFTFTFVVTVRNVQASVVNSPTVCLGNPISFNAAGATDVLVGCSRGYLWYVDGLPPVETTNPSFATTIANPGIHTMTLVVKDINGCTSEVSTSVRVSSVTPDFSLSSNTLCLSNGTLQITDQTSQTPDAIVFYNWNFGDGGVYTSTNSTVPTHTYLNAVVPSSSYFVTLVATNSLGCSAAISKQVTVIQPQVSFQVTPPVFCISAGGVATVSFTPLFPYSSYTMDYGAGSGSTTITSGVSSFNYSLATSYIASVTVKTPAGCENSASYPLLGVQTPTADFLFSSPHATQGNNICSGQIVTFTNVSAVQTPTVDWNLGSGLIASHSNTVSLLYSAPSNSQVVITLTINTGAPAYCSNTAVKNFTIYAYNADFLMSDSIVCANKPLSFSLTPASFGISAWVWSFGDATSSQTLFINSVPLPDPAISHTYNIYPANTVGYASVSLIYWSGDLACRDAKEKLIKVEKVFPNFLRNGEILGIDTAHCLRIKDQFTDSSKVNSKSLTYKWKLAPGVSSTLKQPSYTYTNPGAYAVSLIATNEHNCSDSVTKLMLIYPIPTVTIIPKDDGYCPSIPFDLSMAGSDGIVSGTWTPVSAFSPKNTFTTTTSNNTIIASAASSSTFGLVVTSNYGCISDPVDTAITIVQPPKPVYWDTSVVVGKKIPINVILDKDITYTWTPVVKDLSCQFCLSPVSSSTVDIVYTLVLEDKLRCSQVQSTYSIHILPLTSVDLPTAFTPNGDGINDIIYADGWGIRKLNYLRIYNRWGQLLFESHDINVGWDGNYQGKAQNMDTYVYQVSVDTYIDAEPLTKSSTFKLIR